MPERINVNFKELDKNAITPSYATEFAAGADLYCLDEAVSVEPGHTVMVHTGIALEIPDGIVGLIYARSGLACKKGLAPANKVGVIDSDYRGEIMVALHNHGNEAISFTRGERIAQIVFAPYLFAEFNEREELDDTDRGSGGFGSTGTH